jgi:Plasmid pRiA4b ORF-3-like protein
MVETDRHEGRIYQLRAVLRAISPTIWRRLLVRSDSTVAQLHEVLQIAFGRNDEHLNRFAGEPAEYVSAVCCGEVKCSAPPEDCGGTFGFMANRQHYAGFGRVPSEEDLDDFMDALDDEEPSVSIDYHPDRFDRRQNNRALNKLATGSYEEALDEIHHQSVDRIPRRVATQRPDPVD